MPGAGEERAGIQGQPRPESWFWWSQVPRRPTVVAVVFPALSTWLRALASVSCAACLSPVFHWLIAVDAWLCAQLKIEA